MHMNFSKALEVAATAASEVSLGHALDVRLLRDERGRISFFVTATADQIPPGAMTELTDASKQLGAYSAGGNAAIRTLDDQHDPLGFATEGWHDTWVDRRGAKEPFKIPVKDQATWGRDWLWTKDASLRSSPKRIVFHGLKGGVGRSTALAVLARELARTGRRVLVVDMDIESPGASGILLDPSALPPFGVVDWFVEDAVADAGEVLANMVAESPLSASESGEILVAPAIGGQDREYISKLGRVYGEVGGRRFSDRAETMLEALAAKYTPEVILIDSRAGLHDIAASAITRFSDLSLLFFSDTEQNWRGYRSLFELWRSRPEVLQRVRTKVLAVRALANEQGEFDEFLQKSYALFQDSLYDEVPPGVSDPTLFEFDLNDTDAPHFPPLIHMNSRLHERNLLIAPERGGISDNDVQLAFGGFVRRVLAILELE